MYQSTDDEPNAKIRQPKLATVIVYADELPATLNALLRTGLLEIEIDREGIIRFRPAPRMAK